jgi:hypothetical protein
MRPLVGGDKVRQHIPFWDADNHELLWDGKAIIAFKRAAPLQEPVLEQLQAHGWARRVPTPFLGKLHHKQQTHNAVKFLNARQRFIRFRTCGSGDEISWELRRKRRK